MSAGTDQCDYSYYNTNRSNCQPCLCLCKKQNNRKQENNTAEDKSGFVNSEFKIFER